MTEHAKLTLTLMKEEFSLAKLDPFAGIPTWAVRGEFWAVTRSGADVSVVCATDAIPEGVEATHGWRTLELEGPISFAETGILDSVIEPLSHADISILAVSAYDTNFVLVRDEDIERACTILLGVGHTIHR